MTNQLSLDLSIRPEANMSDFVGNEWERVLDAVRQLCGGLFQECYFYGETLSGKSHLLAALCSLYREMDRTVMYLPLKDLVVIAPDILESIEEYDIIVFDDLEVIAQSREWQEGLFHFINRGRQGNTQLVFTATKPINELHFTLPDLVSRIAQSPVFMMPVAHMTDNRLLSVKHVLERRKLSFNSKIVEYLAFEGPATTSAVLKAVDELQKLSPQIGHKKLSKETREKAFSIIDSFSTL